MIRHRYQKGDAHTVVIIVLVVALIAALGWIFWQNFSKKEEAKKDETPAVVEKKDKEAEKKEEKTGPVLKLEKYGVEIPLDGASVAYGLRYEQFQDGGDTYYITAELDGCTANIGALGPIGKTNELVTGRFKNDTTEGRTWKWMATESEWKDVYAVVGDTVYFLDRPHSPSCTDAEREMKIMNEMKDVLFRKLRASK